MAMVRKYYADWYEMYSRYPYAALSAGGAYPSSTASKSPTQKEFYTIFQTEMNVDFYLLNIDCSCLLPLNRFKSLAIIYVTNTNRQQTTHGILFKN